MREHKVKGLFIWGVISTMVAFYLFNTTQHLEQTNQILSQSNITHKKLVTNERASYEAINDCFVVKRGLCNSDEFREKLQVLGDEADELYTQISLLDKQLK
jgi:hypothetical protein